MEEETNTRVQGQDRPVGEVLGEDYTTGVLRDLLRWKVAEEIVENKEEEGLPTDREGPVDERVICSPYFAWDF